MPATSRSRATIELKKLELPGVYVVKVTDEKTLQATTLVIGSDLDAIVKTSHDQLLVFAQDMKTGQGRAGARVLVADGGQVVLEAMTGADGVLLRDWKPARAGNGRLSYLVLDGPHVAGSGLGVPDQVAQGLTPRAYIYTDRPAYRPGHKVSIRGVVREVANGQYANVPNGGLPLRGRRQPRPADRRPAGHALGLRHVPRVARARHGRAGRHLSRPGLPAGQERLRRQLRGPVVSARADRPGLRLEEDRVLSRRDDPGRRWSRATSTERPWPAGRSRSAARRPHPPRHDRRGRQVSRRVPHRGIRRGAGAAAGRPAAAGQCGRRGDGDAGGPGFRDRPEHDPRRLPRRRVVPLQVVTTDAQGKPIGQSLSAALVKQVDVRRAGHRARNRAQAADDRRQDGPRLARASRSTMPRGAATSSASPGPTGSATRSSPIEPLTISGKKDETKLRLLADRQRYKVGEEASVNLHSRDRAGTALLDLGGRPHPDLQDRHAQGGRQPARLGDRRRRSSPTSRSPPRGCGENELDQARLDIQVERDLRVDVAPAKPVVGPGEPVELDVTTVDQLGRPVSAELSIAMVDQSLLRLYQRPAAARSARSSTTRPAPGPSRPRRPTRSAMRRQPTAVAAGRGRRGRAPGRQVADA